jgi:hypothetical protein
MLRVLREKADSALGPGGMTAREFCEAALGAGAAEAYMVPPDSPGGVPLPGGTLPDGRRFPMSSEADDGFPDADFHMPGMLHLQFYAGEDPGDHGEPDGIYPEISAETALGIIRDRAATSRRGAPHCCCRQARISSRDQPFTSARAPGRARQPSPTATAAASRPADTRLAAPPAAARSPSDRAAAGEDVP